MCHLLFYNYFEYCTSLLGSFCKIEETTIKIQLIKINESLQVNFLNTLIFIYIFLIRTDFPITNYPSHFPITMATSLAPSITFKFNPVVVVPAESVPTVTAVAASATTANAGNKKNL